MQQHVESLERRTLLSGWTTVDQPSGGGYADIASDTAGNVYAVTYEGVVREKAAGSTTWNTRLDLATSTRHIAAAPSGALYIWTTDAAYSTCKVLEVLPGQTTAQVVDEVPIAFDGGSHGDLTVDAAGNLFVGLTDQVVTAFTGKGNKVTYTYQTRWVVRERRAGETAFTTVDSVVSNTNDPYTVGINDMTSIDSGASAGLYAVGVVGSNSGPYPYTYSSEHWVVRKSSNGGASWATVDDFYYSTANSTGYGSHALAVQGDAAGNVYVAGNAILQTATGTTRGKTTYTSTNHWIVKKSGNGGASWTKDVIQVNVDDYRAGVALDAAHNAYVATNETYAGVNHSVIRSNAGGSWNVVDDYANAVGEAMTADPSGNLYAAGSVYSAGTDYAFVRSPVMGAAAPLAGAATFSSSLTAGEAARATDSFFDSIDRQEEILLV